jgi:hypothetical protein
MNERPPEKPRGGEPAVEWTAAEKAVLERLRAGGPPADLEDSVLAALAGRGLVGGGSHAPARPLLEPQSPNVPARRAWAWGAFALAAALAAFYAGISVSDRGTGRATADRYILLLYEDAAYRAPATPEEQADRVAEYVRWIEDVRERGIDVEGEELAPSEESEWLDGRGGEVGAAQGAPGGPLGALAGYFLVAAPDADAAVAIARTTPHLRHGGTVVVRRIVEH